MRHARDNYLVNRDNKGLLLFRRGGEIVEFEKLPSPDKRRLEETVAYKHIFCERALETLPSEDALRALGEAMKQKSLAAAEKEKSGIPPRDSGIPAGYTYLGQFIFHDITAIIPDRTKADDWKNGRTPSLDLDSVLDGIKPDDDLKVATKDELFEIGWTTGNVQELDDLPRIPEADEAAPDRGRPRISDSRNDDFLPLAQCHLLLLKFYNAIARHRGYDGGRRDAYWWAETKKFWVRHFQWVVLHDYLPRIIDCETYRDVMDSRRCIVRPDAKPEDRDWFPLEFAGAVGRFGHSMIRESYKPWNPRKPGDAFGVKQFMEFSYLNSEDHLEGHGFGLPGVWRTNWFKFFDLRKSGEQGDHFDPFMAAAIDTELAPCLFKLPERVPPDECTHSMLSGTGAVEECAESDPGEINLASATLLRGRELRLATAQQALDCASEMLGRPVPGLDAEELFPAEFELASDYKQHLAEATPLWYYILREAECERFGQGKRLGPLGGRIVMETMHAAIEASADSIIDERNWQPLEQIRLNPGHILLPRSSAGIPGR